MNTEEREEVTRILDEARDAVRLLTDHAARIYVLMDELVSVGALSEYAELLATDLGAEANAAADSLRANLRALREEVKELFTSADTD